MRLMEIRSKDKYRSMKKELQLIPDQLPHLSSGGKGEGRGGHHYSQCLPAKVHSVYPEGG